MPTANFFTDPQTSVEQETLNKKQAILDAMSAGALKPLEAPQATGRVVGAISPIAALAKVMESYVAAKAGKNLTEEKQAFADEYRQMLADEGTKFMEESETDPKAAIRSALMSRHPLLQQMALAKLGKEKTYDNIKTLDGRFFDVSTGKPVDIGGPSYTVVQTPGGVAQVQSGSGKWDMVDKAPKVTVNNSISNKGEGKFSEGLGGKLADEVYETAVTKAKQATGNLRLAQNLEAANNRGTFSGPTANLATTLTAFADTMGLPISAEDRKKMGNSESYSAQIASRTAEMLIAGGGVGRSFSDADRQEFVRQFPQLINSPEGRQQIISLIRQSANEDLAQAESVRKQVGNQFPELGRILSTIPQSGYNYPGVQPTTKPSHAPTVSNWPGRR